MEYRCFQVMTQTGQTKYVEIYNGYLEELDLRADILVCSAFRRDYIPTRTSLIGCLDRNFGISVGRLAQRPALNLKDLGVWVSEVLPEAPFGRIACIEMKGNMRFPLPDYDKEISGRMLDVQSLFDTLFFVLNKSAMLGMKAGTVAMPLLGTGNQRMDIKEVAPALVAECIHALNTNQRLEKIIFFEHKKNKYEYICSQFEKRLAAAQPVSVFISYSHRDAEQANAIAVYLEQRGIKVWIDHRKIRNPDYAEEIVRAIQRSTVFLILVSANSQESMNVRRELFNAAKYEDQKLLHIYPVFLEKVAYCESFSYYLQGHDFVDISEPPVEQKLDQLCERVLQTAQKA